MRLSLLALSCLLAATACASHEGDKLARRACDRYGEKASLSKGGAPATAADLADYLRNLHDAVDLASRAATADDSWHDLSTSLNQVDSVVREHQAALTAALEKHASTAQTAELQTMYQEWSQYAVTVDGQCRKAKS